MTELSDFGSIVFIVGASFLAAVLAAKLTRRVPVPTPALFLLAAAVASDAFPRLQGYLSIRDVTRIGVVALIVILFHGGMGIGVDHFRRSAWPTLLLGLPGTFATAAIIAGAAHWTFGFSWTTAGIIGAAIAPTDPAVMFSVLGGREVGGRSGTILEAESGTNDPVGIALMIGLIELATHPHASFTIVIEEFALEIAVGGIAGVVAGRALLSLNNRAALPNAALYPLLTLASATTIYGVASLLHGSGFLAVFVAGLIAGGSDFVRKRETERFHAALSNLAEIVVFVALGLTVDLGATFSGNAATHGFFLAAVLALVARPVVVLALLAPVALRWGERVFIAWAGLKGAVPILLAAFAVLAAIQDAEEIYLIVFVVVMFSVVVQGSMISVVARQLGVPIVTREEEP